MYIETMKIFLINSKKYKGKVALPLWELPKTYKVYVKMDSNEIKPYHCSEYATPCIRKNLLQEMDVDVGSSLWPQVQEALKAYEKQAQNRLNL